MGFDFLSQVAKFLQERKEYRRWLAAFLCLALVVAFGTVAALKLYGQAMTHQEKVLDCQYEVHEHTEDCYEENEDGEKVLACGMADDVIHVHNDDCYNQKGELVCPLEEHEAHEHDDSCYEEEEVLICKEEETEESSEDVEAEEAAGEEPEAAAQTADDSEEPEAAAQTTDDSRDTEDSGSKAEIRKELACSAEEHTHDDSCYKTTETLVCKETEHTHDDGCYSEGEPVLECGETEHTHGDDCYDDEGNLICEEEEHEHDDSCYSEGEAVLDCEESEHTHDDDCYEVTETLDCGKEEHRHDDSCYKEIIEEKDDSEAQEEVKVETEEKTAPEPAAEPKSGESAADGGEAEEGHTHTDDCYETEEVLTCGEPELHTHDVDPESDTCCYTPDCFDKDGNLMEGSRPSCGLLQLEEHVHTEECFKTVELTPEEVAALNNGAKLHIHDDSCYDEDGKLICGHDATHIHGLECYDEDGKLICDHSSQVEAENEKTCKGSGYSVKVTYPDSAKIPEDAKLIVRQITAESDPEHFEEREAEARETLENENINVHALFDIGFYVDGEEIEPQDTVNVTIQLLDDNGLPEGTPMQIVHFAESGNEVLESGDIDSEGNANFDTDSFSEFLLADADGNIAIITGDGLESDDASVNLICGKKEHTHGEECYDEKGNLTCKTEEHTHNAACLEEGKAREEVEKVDQLIAGLPTEEEIAQKMAEYEEKGEEACAEYRTALQRQIQEAYNAYLALDETLRKYVTGADYLLTLVDMMGVSLLDEETGKTTAVPEYAAFLPVGEQPSDGTKNGLVLELLYGDTQSYVDKAPNGEEPNYTRDGMKGNFKLYTSNILGNTDIGDITLSLYFPKEYVDPKAIGILEFPQDQIKHQISQVTEETKDGKEYYKISITLKDYIPTGAITLPFNMKFKVAEVPADYELKIFGTLETGEGNNKKESNPTAENIYRPKYEKPKITKYVNTNVYENMSNDHTRVSANVNKDNIVEDGQYVSFWYKLGDYHQFLRAYDTITLRDTLPTYEDYNGKTQYAVFDPAANPGWVLDPADSDGRTVMRVFKVDDLQGKEHWAPEEYDNKLMLAIAQAELKLKFPGCKIDDGAGADGFLTKDLTNYVGAVCEPYQTPESSSPLHENDDTCEDDLIFTLTNQPGAKGDFTKGNSADTVMDTYTIRSGLYQWCLSFKNNTSTNLVNVEVGDDVIDERLKFKSIVVTKDLLDKIESVEAFTEPLIHDSGEDAAGASPAERSKKKGDIYPSSEFVNTGTLDIKGNEKIDNSYTLTLHPEKEYESFIIHFKDGYVVKPGEGIKVWPYSTFRNPEVSYFVAGKEHDSENVYKNQAYIAYQDERYSKPGDTYYFLISENRFKLIECKESIWVEKAMYECDGMGYPTQNEKGEWEYPWNDGRSNAYGFAQLFIKGSLAENRSYDDLRLIDLLPNSLELYPEKDGRLSLGDPYGRRYIKSYETINNYHNSGRTALIIYLNVDEVRKRLEYSDGSGSANVYISPRLRVNPDAVPGNFTNDVYLVSNDFDAPPTGHGQQPDSLNIQGKGTTAPIRWAQAGGDIQSINGIYARKYIAKEGSEAWSTNALRLKVGDNFQYKLSMMNFNYGSHQNLVVYDVLPRINDKSINNQADRGSEFTVNLRGPIEPPDGYQVYYTTDMEVYSSAMESRVDANIWTQDVQKWTQADWNKVTAFKFVANAGVVFGDGQLDFTIPVKVMDALNADSEEILEGKEGQDRETGTAVFLEATNSFGYSTATYSGQNIESNWVKAQISFAGFVVKKTDENGTVLSGAEFKLEKQVTPTGGTGSDGGSTPDGDTSAQTQDGTDQDPGWETIAEKVSSDEKGKVSFKNLAVGTYRLTETKAPDGYKISTDSVTVTITFDDTTMEYTVTAQGLTGSGTGRDPFVVTNETIYELPETGGSGTIVYTLAGALLTMFGAGFLYKKKFEKRRA